MHLMRQAVYWLLVLSGLAWLAARLNGRKVLVLAYHGVYEGPNDPLLNYDGMHVRASRFARQVRYVARRYRVVRLDELHDEEAAARRRRAVITIDDGYRNIRQVAHPILKARSLPATLFVPTDFVLGGQGMWWDRLRVMLATTRHSTLACSLGGSDHVLPIRTAAERLAAVQALNGEIRNAPPARREEMLAALAARLGVSGRDCGAFGEPLAATDLRDMHRDGMALGSHGTSHASFLHLSADDLDRELAASKNMLERLTRQRVEWLAYPHGDFSPAVADAARRAGYRGAVTTVEALVDTRRNPYALTRIGVHDNMTMAHFIVATSGLHDVVVAAAAAATRRWRRRQLPDAAAFPSPPPALQRADGRAARETS
jgi:peptidoglycan/xylan/chitin deacetylase (PgdA/CDA1 family)